MGARQWCWITDTRPCNTTCTAAYKDGDNVKCELLKPENKSIAVSAVSPHATVKPPKVKR